MPLTPLPRAVDVLERLVAEGKATPPTTSLRNLPLPKAEPPGLPSSEALLAEVRRALERLRSRGADPGDHLRRFFLIDLSRDVRDWAVKVAPELRSLDAAHLATALSLEVELDFVTYDDRLAVAARAAELACELENRRSGGFPGAQCCREPTPSRPARHRPAAATRPLAAGDSCRPPRRARARHRSGRCWRRRQRHRRGSSCRRYPSCRRERT